MEKFESTILKLDVSLGFKNCPIVYRVFSNVLACDRSTPLSQLQRQQLLLQKQQRELLNYQRLLAGLPPIHVRVKSNPVVYHVKYSDVTTVGKVVRQRNRNYSYKADHDLVKKDWERAIEMQAVNYPVKYNRSIIQGKQKWPKAWQGNFSLLPPLANYS